MKIDFSMPILGIDGKPIKIMDKEGQPDFTIRDVAVNSLLADSPGNAGLDGTERVRRFRMADRIFGCREPINLEVEEIVLLKELIAQTYGNVTTARAWDILGGTEAPAPMKGPPHA